MENPFLRPPLALSPLPRDLFRVLSLKGVNRGRRARGRKWGNREMRMVQMAQEVEKGKKEKKTETTATLCRGAAPCGEDGLGDIHL